MKMHISTTYHAPLVPNLLKSDFAFIETFTCNTTVCLKSEGGN